MSKHSHHDDSFYLDGSKFVCHLMCLVDVNQVELLDKLIIQSLVITIRVIMNTMNRYIFSSNVEQNSNKRFIVPQTRGWRSSFFIFKEIL